LTLGATAVILFVATVIAFLEPLAEAALRFAAIFAVLDFAATGLRIFVTCFLGAVRETAFAAFRAGAFAPLVRFTICLG